MVVRGVSTVLDAALFCLLVTAAVATLTVPSVPPPEEGTADGTARALATSTVTVQHGDRTAHGTPAALLARAAVRSAILGETATGPDGRFRRAVTDAARRIARHRSHGVRVRAAWRPYPGASIRGVVTAGPTPPPDADVDAAQLVVPGPVPAVGERALETARADGYAGVARVLATTVVRARFPPEAARLALYGPDPVADRTAARYRVFAGAAGVSVDEPLAAANATRANRRLAAALAANIERDLRATFEDPTAAARGLTAGRVTVTVRTWSA